MAVGVGLAVKAFEARSGDDAGTGSNLFGGFKGVSDFGSGSEDDAFEVTFFFFEDVGSFGDSIAADG